MSTGTSCSQSRSQTCNTVKRISFYPNFQNSSFKLFIKIDKFLYMKKLTFKVLVVRCKLSKTHTKSGLNEVNFVEVLRIRIRMNLHWILSLGTRMQSQIKILTNLMPKLPWLAKVSEKFLRKGTGTLMWKLFLGEICVLANFLLL